ncbi:3-demethylubiquinone-9 3-methyltransferase [Thiorhodovibrio litoralis]|nr:3-demethylubiquinone-9 3-methyltransferase [Thiorhodovibrio litoralis]
MPGGNLYKCSVCHLGFRWPQKSKRELDLLYANGEHETWSKNSDRRRDWQKARDWLGTNMARGSSVLDIGCFDGGFLEPLTTVFRCFGVEINSQARSRAEAQGIMTAGKDLAELAGTFDCITAFDIIEHVQSPRIFLESCFARIKPGGRILLSTGNLESRSFRFMRSRYYYCAKPEHIAFISPEWMEGCAKTLGLKIEHVAFYSHVKATSLKKTKEILINVSYRILPALIRWARMKGLSAKDTRRFPVLADYPPSWTSANDHFLVVLRKP